MTVPTLDLGSDSLPAMSPRDGNSLSDKFTRFSVVFTSVLAQRARGFDVRVARGHRGSPKNTITNLS